MDKSFEEEIREAFLEESEELLASWESCCIEIEKELETETLNKLFRAAHTLKGSSHPAGFHTFSKFVHHIEDAIKSVQSNGTNELTHFVQTLFDAHSVMTDWLGGEEVTEDRKTALLNAVQIIKDPSGASVVESSSVQEGKSEEIVPAVQESQAAAHIQLVEKSEEGSKSKKEEKKAAAKDEVLRVKRSRIDSIMKSVGELGTHLSVMQHHFLNKTFDSKEAQSALDFCQKYAFQIQETSMSLSMQSLDRFFQRLERSCKDVARISGKKIEVNKEGSDVELDKMILDQIADPFIHLIRNAADHGIESPDVRLKSGKSPSGHVLIKAEHEAGMITITIKDDGAGIDHEKIYQKAISKGLIRDGTILSKDEKLQLITMPGFSTKENITEISGRGVGMDVVQSTLNYLGGMLNIRSQVGQGSSFVVSLPTSASLVSSILFKAAGQLYGVPLNHFSEVVDLEGSEVFTSKSGDLMFNLRSELVSLHDFDRFLKSRSMNNEEETFHSAAIINRSRGKPIAFKIEELYGCKNLFVKPLEGKLKNMKGISGTTIFPDGQAGLILNLSEIVGSFHNKYVA